MNSFLFPELDYRTNPAFQTNVKEKFLSGNIKLDTSYESDKKTRTDDSVGAAGGTETLTDFSLVPAVDFMIFTRLRIRISSDSD